jgi:hypothetical protein
MLYSATMTPAWHLTGAFFTYGPRPFMSAFGRALLDRRTPLALAHTR